MQCPICNSKDFSQLRAIKEISRYTKKAYPLFKCKSCGLVRPEPLPYKDDGKLKIYDNAENIKFYNKKEKKIETESYEYKYYFKHFKPYIEFARKYRIKGKSLDVGCGAGHLLIMLQKEGLKAEGLEITEKLVQALKGKFKIYGYGIEDKRIKKKYDLLTLNQVLEHIEKPDNFVKHLNRVLKKSGYVILAVPYIYGLVPKILRTKWYGLGYGQHLNFFSEKNLRILFEKNGFEIYEFKILGVDYAHPRFPKFLNTIADFISMVLVKAGLGDNLFMVARKVNEVKI